MEIKEAKKMTGDLTYSFSVDGRTNQEVKDMKESGFCELPRFKGAGPNLRKDGYFCGSCRVWKNTEFAMPKNSSTHDGICMKYNYRSRDFGCCAAWAAKQGLFDFNPVI